MLKDAFIRPGRTAIARKTISAPARFVLSMFMGHTTKMLDFGCGHGTDVRLLTKKGVNIAGYDAFHKEYNRRPRGSFDLVTLNFVINVLPKEHRDKCLKDAWACVRKGGILFVSARPIKDVLRYSSSWDIYEDGWLTSVKTFQTGYSQDALGLYLMDQLGAAEVHTGTCPTFVYGWVKKS